MARHPGAPEKPSTERGGTRAAGTAKGSGFPDVVASYSVAQEEIEGAGGEKVADDYRVGYIVEGAEGWWQGEGTNLEWRDPATMETNHIEILPYDKNTGLLVPYMDISLAVLDESGEEVAGQDLDFYCSELPHYANNFSLPESGTYTLRAELGPPEFMRHGSEGGEER